MDERLRESLSALMDNEANELELERVLARIGDDAELRATWVRYNGARSAAGGQATTSLSVDISARVREAVAAESSAMEQPPLVERLWRPVASFAVAASVAAVVVVGGQQLNEVGTGAPAATPVGLGNIAGATPVQASYGTLPVPQLQPTTHTAYRELARQRMQRYMQQHAEQAALNSPQGLLPFARVPQISE